jgi:hypothetical protein
MKKPLASLIALTFVISSFSIPAYAAVKAGAKCATKGEIKTSQGKKFTCVKSGKTLVWNKGVVVKTSGGVVTPPAPTLTPAASPTPTPTSKVIPASWPLNKSVESVENLLAIADASERRYISELKPSEIKFDIRLGPTSSKARADEFLAPLKLAAQYWSADFASKEAVVIAVAEVKDFDFMKNLWPQYGLNGGGFDNSEATWARNGTACNQGSAIYDRVPFFWGCMSSAGSLEVIGLRKFTAHEFTHLVQYDVINKQAGKGFWGLPLIFMEGSADYFGITYSSTTEKFQADWSQYRSTGYISSQVKNELKSANASKMLELMLDSMSGGRMLDGHSYFTGAYLTARLVAAKGHKGYVEYMYEYGLSGNANAAFEKVYGVTFQEFATTVSPELVEFAKLLQ